MITMNTRQLHQLERQLGRLNKRGIPFAVRNTINDLAFMTQREARETISEKFTERNQWTGRSVQVERARSTRDVSVVGSREKYMADQEFGAIVDGDVPTATAAGEGMAAARSRPIRRPNWRPNLTVGPRPRKGSRKQRAAATIAMAAREGRKVIYLETQRGKGIFKLMGGRRRPKLRLLWDMTKRSRTLAATPWLRPATLQTVPHTDRIYARRLIEQLRRMR